MNTQPSQRDWSDFSDEDFDVDLSVGPNEFLIDDVEDLEYEAANEDLWGVVADVDDSWESSGGDSYLYY